MINWHFAPAENRAGPVKYAAGAKCRFTNKNIFLRKIWGTVYFPAGFGGKYNIFAVKRDGEF